MSRRRFNSKNGFISDAKHPVIDKAGIIRSKQIKAGQIWYAHWPYDMEEGIVLDKDKMIVSAKGDERPVYVLSTNDTTI